MKITDVKVFIVDAFRTNYVFTKIETDEGISGVGEGTVEGREPTVAAAIKETARYLVGRDPFEVEQHCEILNRDSYYRTGVILRSALSAVEAAMLDIKGKGLGVPVYELLGGKIRDRINCYANAWFVGAKEPEEFAERAVKAVDNGFNALKWDPFGSSYMQMDIAERKRTVKTVEAVRNAVGDNIDLMIEVHGRLDVPTAIRMAHELAPFKPFWYEEPVPPESIEALADVRAHSPIPIASGERYYEPSRFGEMLDRRAADYWQPDVCHVGGMMALQKIAAIARTRYLPVAPHNPIGPIANAMTLHLAASIPNFAILETMATDVPWRSEIVREDVQLIDGAMTIPTAPGLGVELDEGACRRFPYKPHALRHYTGELTDIRPPESEIAFFQAESESPSSVRPDPKQLPT